MRAQTVGRFITVDDLCSSELDSLLPKIGSELSDKGSSNRRIMPELTVQNGSSLHPHTWMIKTNRLFLKLSAHPELVF